MKFTKLNDLLQYFINEYVLPKSKILIVGEYIDPSIFTFINIDPYYIKDCLDFGIDFVVNYSNLPFENESFDYLINFTDHSFKEYLKKESTSLVLGTIINALDYYTLEKCVFSVI
jgi:hypothetical protein